MKCFLICQNNTHDPIPLPDGCPVYVGRNPLCKIIDKRCSRQQLEFIADYRSRQVAVKQTGNNASAVGSVELTPGETMTVSDGTVVYVLTDLFPHQVKFSDSSHTENGAKSSKTSSDSLEKSKAKKRKSLEQSSCEESVKKPKLEKTESKQKDVRRSVSREDSEESRLKDVEEKLKMMKSQAKRENSDTPKKQSVEPKLGKATAECTWEQTGKLLTYISEGVKASSKIAGFDIDGTIIGTLSGKVFATHAGDWKILYGEIPTKLKRLHNDGFKIVFFTNQMGVERGKTKVPDLKTKFTGVISRVGVPVQLLISTGSGIYRKPATGMWDYLLQQGNDGVEVDMKSSFYVGDAAGRPEKWSKGKKKDFSCSDRLFAMNLGLKFYTPEEYFQGWKPAPFKLPDFNPMTLKCDLPLTSPSSADVVSTHQEVRSLVYLQRGDNSMQVFFCRPEYVRELDVSCHRSSLVSVLAISPNSKVVVTVGFPASGKTHFVQTQMLKADYIHVNRDKLGSWQKCVAACTKALQQNHSVVVDNTSPDPESRQRYLEVARKLKVPCRCFYFTATVQQARHNERFREMTDKSHQSINDMIMNSYKSKFKEPQVSEGFTEIVKVNFVPKFSNPDHKKLFFQYLMDK